MGATLVGRRIRAARLDRLLYQSQLAEKASLTERTVGRIENGHTLPKLDTLARLAKPLGIKPSVLAADLALDLEGLRELAPA